MYRRVGSAPRQHGSLPAASLHRGSRKLRLLSSSCPHGAHTCGHDDMINVIRVIVFLQLRALSGPQPAALFAFARRGLRVRFSSSPPGLTCSSKDRCRRSLLFSVRAFRNTAVIGCEESEENLHHEMGGLRVSSLFNVMFVLLIVLSWSKIVTLASHLSWWVRVGADFSREMANLPINDQPSNPSGTLQSTPEEPGGGIATSAAIDPKRWPARCLARLLMSQSRPTMAPTSKCLKNTAVLGCFYSGFRTSSCRIDPQALGYLVHFELL